VHAPPRPAGELLRGGLAAMEDGRDVRKRHAEHVVQHERRSLGGTERVEHHEQGEPGRLSDQRLLLGVGAVIEADDRVGQVDVCEFFAPRCLARLA
jgi:hypothetical protein